MHVLGFLFQLQLCFSEPVTNHSFAFRCLPQDSERQRILSASIHMYPEYALYPTVDAFGLKHTAFIKNPHAGISVQAEGCVEITENAVAAPFPPQKLGPYRSFSELTVPGGTLIGLSQSLPSRNTSDAVMKMLEQRFTYLPGSTQSSTTAEEAAAMMRGVCQDEAHIMLSLLRLKEIPCRYVMGYMLGEGATHAWVDVWNGEKWIGLDPTNKRAVNEDYITIAVGRDANDCPVNRGLFTGSAVQKSQHSLSVWTINK